MSEPRPRIAVLVFPGSQDDGDAALALELVGAEAQLVWHGEPELPDVQAVVLTESPPLAQRDPHRFEVARTDDLHIHEGIALLLVHALAFHHNSGLAVVLIERQRQTVVGGHGGDSGNSA